MGRRAKALFCVTLSRLRRFQLGAFNFNLKSSDWLASHERSIGVGLALASTVINRCTSQRFSTPGRRQ
jgi:hypothetical protein